MRQVECGTSWQSKASMLPSANLIAQRLQIEALRCCRRAYKSCRKTQQQVRIDGHRLTGSAKSTPAARLAATVAGMSSRESGISWRDSPSRA
jgi:hypothetical protein